MRVPQNLPWEQADLSIQHPRSQWAKWGVTRADGKPLEADALPTSLVLPMGRFGPAFLAYDNFKVYTEWNNSLIYSLTAAYYATRLAGAPAYNPRQGDKIPGLNVDEMRELQTLLAKRGFDVGRIDGILGLKSRQAVRDHADQAQAAGRFLADGGTAGPSARRQIKSRRKRMTLIRTLARSRLRPRGRAGARAGRTPTRRAFRTGSCG